MGFKEELRSTLIEELWEISPSDHIESSKRISSNLYNYLTENQLLNKRIGVFSPIQKEPNWSQSIPKPFKVAYPHYGQKRLFIESDEFYVENQPNWPEAKVCSPDILLIPGLGFDKKRNRLGRGGGFYDQYLSEDHDQKMSVVITEENIYS